MKAVAELGEVALAPLIVALEQIDDYSVRVRAATALGKLGDARAVEALGVAVKDDDEWPVRQQAAKALGELGDAQAVEPLIVAIKEKKDDYSYEVQMAAAAALAKLGDARAVEALADVLTDDGEWPVRKAAAQALGEIGDARAVGPLTAALGDAEERVQACVAEALEAVRSRAGRDKAGTGDVGPAEVVTEGDFDAVMTKVGSKKIEVIKVIRGKAGLDLREAKGLADSAPSVILTGVSQAAAEEIVSALKAVGATAEVRTVAGAPVPVEVEAGTALAGDFDAVMTKVGPQVIEVIKVIRARTGLGLAEAKSLVDDAPSVVLTGMSQADAEEIVSALKAVGASAEVRAAAEAPITMDVDTETEPVTDAAPSGRAPGEPVVPVTPLEQAPSATKPSFAPQSARSGTMFPLGVNLVLSVLTLACCATSAYCILLADDASGAAQICGALSVLGTVALLIFTLVGWLGVGRQG
jgi:ribosomal protein L7/L12